MTTSDVLILGGGIVGLATAYELAQRFPSYHVTLLEKEPQLAQHQSSHNSGVLHSGIYYRPGSLRAINCREGKRRMEQFCTEHSIPFDICGKVIVAVSHDEVPALERIFERGQANGVRCEMIQPQRLHELEPHAAGVRAIHVPEAGIVSYAQVCRRLSDLVTQHGHRIVTSTRVCGMRQEPDCVIVQSTQGDFTARHVINCTGLFSDRVARLSGAKLQAKIVPFRGEFYQLRPDAHHLCKSLIYPVPDARFPFLGVHFTRVIDGTVECGPNAVLALAREGYRKLDVNLCDLAESLTYGGFLRLAMTYWRTGAGELWRSFSKQAFVRALQRLVPAIQAEHLSPAPSGVRAQAVTPDGNLVDDFLVEQCGRVINVCNAPSPAATSSLNVGRLIVDKLMP
jgi:L-2-hydroxyglutarate oxidase